MIAKPPDDAWLWQSLEQECRCERSSHELEAAQNEFELRTTV